MTKPFSERLLLIIGIVVAVLGSLLPFIWFVLTSLKSQIQVEAIPPTWWPDGSIEFYQSAIIDHHLFNYIWNSVIVASSTTIMHLSSRPQPPTRWRGFVSRAKCGSWAGYSVSPCFRKLSLPDLCGKY